MKRFTRYVLMTMIPSVRKTGKLNVRNAIPRIKHGFSKLVVLTAILLAPHTNVFAQAVVFGAPYGVSNTYTVPAGVYFLAVDAKGASGGNNSAGVLGGNGGAVTCTLSVAPATVFDVWVGGTSGLGGFAGGAPGNAGTGGTGTGGGARSGTPGATGGSGGGSSDIRTTGGNIIVGAGGGGGGGSSVGGDAGAGTGGAGNPGNIGTGGTTPGAAGSGGAVTGIGTAGTAGGNGGNGGSATGGGAVGGNGGDAGGGGGGGYANGTGGTNGTPGNSISGGGAVGGNGSGAGSGGGGANYINTTGYTYTGTTANGIASSAGNGSVSLTPYPSVAGYVGGTTICMSSTILLTAGVPAGGTWSTSAPGVATISAASGSPITVTGLSAGTSDITYSIPGGYYSIVTVMVTSGTLLPITGPSMVCTGSSITLHSATTGGTWSSSSTAVATVSSTGDVGGVSAGTTVIDYTTGSCTEAQAVTVGTAPITGAATVCTGSTTSLSDATPGGTWSSSNTLVATVSATGVVYGVTVGTSVISYIFGSCSQAFTITVNPLPPITGSTTVCVGATITLSDATTGGIWSSGTTSVATVGSGSGAVHGVSAGTSIISYTSGGCSAQTTVTVISLSAISGTLTLCAGSTVTLANSTPGGTWSSGSTAIATVDPGTGVVTGVSTGSARITYALGGCSVTTTVTVSGSLAAITGPSVVCAGSTMTLSDATASGTWSSTNTSVATVTPGSGIVSGIAAGTTTISYTVGTCSVGFVVTVSPANAGTITGKDSLCIGAAHSITLSDAVSGGAWSSTSRATVDPVTGVVTGVTSGLDTVTYTVTNTCGTFKATKVIYIRTAAKCATGINAVAEEQATGLKVFPNPNSGEFTMNLMSDIDEDAHIVVTNIMGATVQEYTTTTNRAVKIKLDAASGMYLLSVSTAHGRYIAKVMVN